ncbi:MAG: ADP-ribosylglycohydrolase family protein [Prevotella sp.]|nr:ADP-ribosylglycohydrolase family protein [Prevotella sp.]
MLGAIIGDIVGSRFEFDEKPTEGFELFTDTCDFTDDTICTVAIADAILNNRDYKEALLDWCGRYPDPKGGYGNMFWKWLHSSNPLPHASFGNGAAMRVSPVGWLFNDYKDVMEQAKMSAEVSHCHSEGIKGAQCVATVIYWLRTTRLTKDEIEGAVLKNFDYKIPSLRDIYRLGDLGHFDSTCQETVPFALRCFLDAENFEDTLRKTIMAQGDTDTKGAIACSMAEACYEIPEEIAERAYEYLPAEMLAIIEQFYDRYLSNIGED